MSDKLNINNEMRQFDLKNRGFYDELTAEEKKKFSLFLMLRWGSSVQVSDKNIEAYYIMSLNERLNTNFFDLSKHPKLQWLCATTVSPGIGTFKHQWIPPKKREGVDNKSTKFLKEIYPHLKEDEIDLLRKLNTKDDLKRLAREHGWDDKRIKSDL
jgi:hypothetical protein